MVCKKKKKKKSKKKRNEYFTATGRKEGEIILKMSRMRCWHLSNCANKYKNNNNNNNSEQHYENINKAERNEKK